MDMGNNFYELDFDVFCKSGNQVGGFYNVSLQMKD